MALAEQLKEAQFGEHNLLGYQSLSIFRNVYSSYTKHALVDNNEIVLILPFYETSQNVATNLDELVGVDVETHLENGTLAIEDSLKAYMLNDPIVIPSLFKLHQKITRDIKNLATQAKLQGKTGCSIIADMGPFFHRGLLGQLIDYEISISTNKENSDEYNNYPEKEEKKKKNWRMVKAICSYHVRDLIRLNNEQKRTITQIHNRKVGSRDFEKIIAGSINKSTINDSA